MNPIYSSGAIKLRDVRPVSKSLQVFETNPEMWPVNQPIPKLDGLVSTKNNNFLYNTFIVSDKFLKVRFKKFYCTEREEAAELAFNLSFLKLR